MDSTSHPVSARIFLQDAPWGHRHQASNAGSPSKPLLIGVIILTSLLRTEATRSAAGGLIRPHICVRPSVVLSHLHHSTICILNSKPFTHLSTCISLAIHLISCSYFLINIHPMLSSSPSFAVSISPLIWFSVVEIQSVKSSRPHSRPPTWRNITTTLNIQNTWKYSRISSIQW